MAEYVVQGNYGYGNGYEDVSTYPDTPEGKKEARDDLIAYRENEPEYTHRIIKRATPE